MRSWMIAYIAGVLLFHLWGELIPASYLIAALCLSALSFVFLSRFRWIVILVVAVAWSSLYSEMNKNKVIDEIFENTNLVATGYVCSIPKRKKSFVAFELCDASIYLKDKQEYSAEGLRLKLNWYTKEDVQLRGVNTFDIRLKKPHGMVNPSGFLYEKWLFRKGIHGVGYIKRLNSFASDEAPFIAGSCELFSLLCRLTVFRIEINDYLSNYANEFVNISVIKALSIGYRGDIPEESWELFKNTGTQHLIAISGLHVGMVFSAAFVFFSLIFSLLKYTLASRFYVSVQRKKALISIVLSLFIAFMYSALAGFSVSTQRALLMIFVFVLCRLLRLGISANTRLMIAALIILVIDPNSVLDYGFWLSFLAVWTLFLVASSGIKVDKSVKNKRPASWFARFKSAVNMQWLICVGLCPVLLISGMGVSYTSMIANFVAIPLVGLLTVPLVFISLVLAPISVQISSWFLHLADVSLLILFKYLHVFSDYPGVNINLTSLGLVFAVSLIILFILIFPLWRVLKIWAILTVFMLLGLKLEPSVESGTELIVLDVGQGLSVVAINGVRAVVYDTGPEYRHGNAAERSLIPFLRAKGVKEIEMLVLSHGDSDHAGGLADIESEFNVVKAISGEPERLKRKINSVECINDNQVETDWYKANFFFLAHEQGVQSLSGLSSNNHSCVLRLQFNNFSVLLMGDLEKKAEKEFVRQYRDVLFSDILVAGHHGSKNATGYRLLNAVNPQLVVFSSGYKNRFNHPHPNTVARVVNQGAAQYNTASDGAIIISSDQDDSLMTKIQDIKNKKLKVVLKVVKQREVDDAFWMF